MSILRNESNTLSQLISPRRDINRPIYNWHSFKHSYSKDFVDHFIDKLNLKNGDFVFDPFVGGGTTLLACKERGINAIGTDILPFSVFLTNTKVADYNFKKLEHTKNWLKKKHTELNGHLKFDYPDIGIVKLAYSPALWRELNKINFIVKKIRDKNSRQLFKLALLSILDQVGNAEKAGGFLRIVENDFKTKDLFEFYLSKVELMIGHIEVTEQSKEKTQSKAILADARKIPLRKKFDAIITSPPYPNRHDYTRIYGLELAFDFVKSNQQLKGIRYETLRSHVEAKRIFKSRNYQKPNSLDSLLSQVKNNGMNNPQVMSMLEGYFEDMFLVFKSCTKILKNNGKMILCVSNVRFSGINIPVDKLLCEVAEQCSFETENILIARYRGNSAQQMGEYEKKPSRESVIVLVKK